MKKNDQSLAIGTAKTKKTQKRPKLEPNRHGKEAWFEQRGYRCYETDKYRIPLSVKYAVLYWTEAKKQKKPPKA